MGLLRNKFNIPLTASRQRKSTAVIQPTFDFSYLIPQDTVPWGKWPQMDNMMVRDNLLVPRSCLSRFDFSEGPGGGNASLLNNDVPLYEFRARSRTGPEVLFMLSAGSLIQMTLESGSSWTRVTGPTFASTATKGLGFYQGFYDHTELWLESDSTKYAIITNWLELPKKVPVVQTIPGQASYISSFLSVSSYARFCKVYDERLVFFAELAQGGQSREYRVRWSVRGSGLSFQEEGSGFQDLESMKGIASGLITHNNELLLLTTEQVWRATARKDAYAFDFAPLIETVGCLNPHTLHITPRGPIFLGTNLYLYVIQGNQAIPIGDHVRGNVHQYLERSIRELPLAFSIYNPDEKQYTLFYSDTTGNYPERAVVLDVDSIVPTEDGTLAGNWWTWSFPYQLTTGVAVPRITSAAMAAFWWTRSTAVARSNGRSEIFLSSQTNDTGTNPTFQLESANIVVGKETPYNTVAVSEVFLSYWATGGSTSTVSVFAGAPGTTQIEVGSAALAGTAGQDAFIPVTTRAERVNQITFYFHPVLGGEPKIGKMQLTLHGYSGKMD